MRYQKALLITFCILSLLMLISLAAAYYFFVIKYPGDHISKENIVRLLSMESPVYYRDDTNRVGVFFDEQHRRYLKIQHPDTPSTAGETEEAEDYIPKIFLQAVIAAEDKKFYDHHGIDYLGILRAAWVNLKAGRIVQGGSTLTQQCAKNIFRRQGRTFKQKFQELINALRLEYHYTKDEILEFYCNQFYVTGNGRGLGIAARYYFNKPAKDLNLIEAAYIAGSLKGPLRYDPFLKQDPEEERKILERARARTDYVLSRMYHQGMIDVEMYKKARQMEIPFSRGEFRFANNVILDYVRDKLESERFQGILESHGISNLATSGIKIITTLDIDIQQGAQAALQTHLSYLETVLKGYSPVPEKPDSTFDLKPAMLKEKGFYLGRITDMVDKGRQSFFSISVNGHKGRVDYHGLKRFAEKINTFEKGYYAGAGAGDVKKLFKRFQKGDAVYVSAYRTGAETNQILFDIEQRPQINGGVIVLDKGQVRAMVGGFTNTNFNRALYAKREPGSVFKTIIYLAALTLNWNNLDELINKRNVFVFQNQFYFPKPDHEILSDKVSMTMAGVKSENVASVYLLNNLVNKLTKEQFIKVAEDVGLTQKKEENYQDYVKRIRDQYGIVATTAQLKRGIFEMAKKQFILELTFQKEEDQIFALKHLPYGLGFVKKSKALKKRLAKTKTAGTEGLEEELRTQLDILKNNYLSLKASALSAKKKLEELRTSLADIFRQGPQENPSQYDTLFEHFYVPMPTDGKEPNNIIFTLDTSENKHLQPLTLTRYLKMLGSPREETTDPAGLLAEENIRIEGLLSLKLLNDIDAHIEKIFQTLQRHRRYDLECLYHHKEFRIMTGLLYVIKLARSLGIASELRPVLSFPLGTNSVTLAETARAYQTLLEGKTYHFSEASRRNGIAVISRIEDPQGNLIYQWSPASKTVIAPSLGLAVVNILRQVVTHGTARAADRQLTLTANSLTADEGLPGLKFRFPVMGKTGTTNNYTNATFVGFLPYYPEGGSELSLANTYTIACYVGYDTNESMVHKGNGGSLRISGASGALPVWIKTAEHIIKSKNFSASVDMVDLAFQTKDTIPFAAFDQMIAVAVDPVSGLPVYSEGGKAEQLSFRTLGKISQDEYILDRFFEPVADDF